MATLTIRNVPDDVRDRLRVRAARNGRSMEAEARALLAEAVVEGAGAPKPSVRERVRRLKAAFAPYRSAAGSVADELIAERRLEGWKENLDAARADPPPRAGAASRG
jgi:plasmid stability protein